MNRSLLALSAQDDEHGLKENVKVQDERPPLDIQIVVLDLVFRFQVI